MAQAAFLVKPPCFAPGLVAWLGSGLCRGGSTWLKRWLGAQARGLSISRNKGQAVCGWVAQFCDLWYQIGQLSSGVGLILKSFCCH